MWRPINFVHRPFSSSADKRSSQSVSDFAGSKTTRFVCVHWIFLSRNFSSEDKSLRGRHQKLDCGKTEYDAMEGMDCVYRQEQLYGNAFSVRFGVKIY